MTLEFENDDVLTSQEVGLLIQAGIQQGKTVVLQIGDKQRMVKWIGEYDLHDPPRLPRWRIEIEK